MAGFAHRAAHAQSLVAVPVVMGRSTPSSARPRSLLATRTDPTVYPWSRSALTVALAITASARIAASRRVRARRKQSVLMCAAGASAERGQLPIELRVMMAIDRELSLDDYWDSAAGDWDLEGIADDFRISGQQIMDLPQELLELAARDPALELGDYWAGEQAWDMASLLEDHRLVFGEPSPPTPPPPQGEQMRKKWSCQMCEALNFPSASECHRCGAAKPPSAAPTQSAAGVAGSTGAPHASALPADVPPPWAQGGSAADGTTATLDLIQETRTLREEVGFLVQDVRALRQSLQGSDTATATAHPSGSEGEKAFAAGGAPASAVDMGQPGGRGTMAVSASPASEVPSNLPPIPSPLPPVPAGVLDGMLKPSVSGAGTPPAVPGKPSPQSQPQSPPPPRGPPERWEEVLVAMEQWQDPYVGSRGF